MTKKLPSFLRLHIDDELIAQASSCGIHDPYGTVGKAFEVATGWSLDHTLASFDGNAHHRHRLELKATAEDDRGQADTPQIERWRAAQLADALSDLFFQVDTLQLAVWQREAELAIGVPVSPRRQGEEHLAARLEVMLKNGAEAIGCCAAGLYLLDDTTSELKLRACCGLPKDRLLAPPRPLAGAFAELEALLGHAIVLEQVSLVPHWKTPEPYPAALCLPVTSPTDPLGTIWFFADKVRDFSDREIHLAEIIAGSMAAELQREVLLGECLASKRADRQIVHAAQWQHDHLPTIKPLVDDWDVAGWSAADDGLVRGFYDWLIPPDGSLAVAFGTSDGLPVESALSASAAQAAVRAHADYAHDTAKMITRVNDTLWNSSAGGHEVSLLYGKVTPGTGVLEYSIAGMLQAILVQRSGVELIQSAVPRLGISPELDPSAIHHCLGKGDLLLILASTSERPSLQLEISRQLRAHRTATAEELLQLVRSLDPGAELALILQRRASSDVPGN